MASEQHQPNSTSHSDPVTAAQHFIDNVEAVNARLNAFWEITPAETILDEAQQSLDRWRTGQQLSPVDGVLVSVKDNVARKGQPCRSGSAGRPAIPEERDAPAMRRMLAAGMILVGRTTMPDHGCKATTHGGLHGTARNPWNPDLTPGGSSGGAAASVAAGLTRVALGSDGGGSIRIPAAFCGVVGLKPTYGRIPVLSGSPFDAIIHQGPIGSSVADVAALLDTVSEESHRRTAPVLPGMHLSGMRFTVWDDFPSTDPEIREGVARAAAVLSELGAVATPWNTDLSVAKFPYEMAFLEGSARAVASLAPDAPMDPVLRKWAKDGQTVTDGDRDAARAQLHTLRGVVDDLFTTVDVILSPVSECLPFEVEQEAPRSGTDRTHEWHPSTYPFNLSGNPAISVPVGISQSRLPIAIQLVGRANSEGLLLRVAAQLEAVFGQIHPPLMAAPVGALR